MDYLKEVEVVLVNHDKDGRAVFAESPKPATNYIPGAVEAAYVWGTEAIPSLPDNIGGQVSSVSFPPPGGSRLGFVCFPPHSAGKLDMPSQVDCSQVELGSSGGMHQSDSLDYEIIVQGKIDIVLDNGARRTLHPGSCLIMGGAMHAWENIYDEPCIFGVILLGTNPVSSEEHPG